MKLKMFLTVVGLLPILVVASEVSCTSNSASLCTELFANLISKEPMASEDEILKSEGIGALLKASEQTIERHPFRPHKVSGHETQLDSSTLEEVKKPDSSNQRILLSEAWPIAPGWDCIETRALTTSKNQPWTKTKFAAHGVCSRNYVTPEPNLFNPNQRKNQLPLKVEKVGHAGTRKNYPVFADHGNPHSPSISFFPNPRGTYINDKS